MVEGGFAPGSGSARLLHSVRRPTRRDRSLLSIPSFKVLATTCLVRTLSQISFRFPVPLVPFVALAGVFVRLVFFPRSHRVHSSSQGRLGLHSSVVQVFQLPLHVFTVYLFPNAVVGSHKYMLNCEILAWVSQIAVT